MLKKNDLKVQQAYQGSENLQDQDFENKGSPER